MAAGLTGCIGGDDGPEGQTTNTATPGTGGNAGAGGTQGTGTAANGSDEDALRANATPAHLQGNMSFAGCTLNVGLLPFPEEIVRDVLPSGWEPVSYMDLPLLYQGFVAASSCDAYDSEPLADSVPLMMAGVLAEPPSEFRGPVDVHAVLVGILVEDAFVFEQFRAWRVDSIELAEITSTTSVTAAGSVAYYEALVDGWGVRFEAVTPATPFELGSTSMRVFDIGGLSAAFDIRWTSDAGFGPGEALGWTGGAGLPTDPFPPGLSAFLGGTPEFGFTFEPAAMPSDTPANATASANLGPPPSWRALLLR